jgi:hypothetical protein
MQLNDKKIYLFERLCFMFCTSNDGRQIILTWQNKSDSNSFYVQMV